MANCYNRSKAFIMKNKFNIIHHYFTKLYEYSVALQKNFDAESIHAFRVTAKKLRALLRMLRCSKPGNKTMKLSRRIKNMYLLTGKIRAASGGRCSVHLCCWRLKSGSCHRRPSGEGSLVVTLLTLDLPDSNLPNGSRGARRRLSLNDRLQSERS